MKLNVKKKDTCALTHRCLFAVSLSGGDKKSINLKTDLRENMKVHYQKKINIHLNITRNGKTKSTEKQNIFVSL